MARIAAGRRRGLVVVQPLRGPQDRDVDDAGEHKMRRQAILRDFDAMDQAGRHHPPADRALQRAEAENQP